MDRQVVAVILAGGQGRRMGGVDKAMVSETVQRRLAQTANALRLQPEVIIG